MNSLNILPRLSDTPLRARGPHETWIDWARETYAHTLAELALSRTNWEARYGRHPGPSYTSMMQAQEKRLREQITRHLTPSVMLTPGETLAGMATPQYGGR